MHYFEKTIDLNAVVFLHYNRLNLSSPRKTSFFDQKYIDQTIEKPATKDACNRQLQKKKEKQRKGLIGANWPPVAAGISRRSPSKKPKKSSP